MGGRRGARSRLDVRKGAGGLRSFCIKGRIMCTTTWVPRGPPGPSDHLEGAGLLLNSSWTNENMLCDSAADCSVEHASRVQNGVLSMSQDRREFVTNSGRRLCSRPSMQALYRMGPGAHVPSPVMV